MRSGRVVVGGLIVAALIAGGAYVAVKRGIGPLPDPKRCVAEASGYSVAMSTEQAENASIIAAVAERRGLPARAISIAIATAYQESKLENVEGGDRDSLGLFQQRPSAGWGTPAQIMDPVYASTKFYEKLKTVVGWETLSLTEAAQRVQVSAYPDAYAKHEPLATQIVNLLADGAANAVGNSLTMVCAAAGQIAASGWTIPVKASVGSGFRTPSRPTHQGVDLIIGRYTPIHAATSGVVSVVKCDEDHRGRLDCNHDGYPGKGGCGWMVEIQHAGDVMTRYCHMVQRPFVRIGENVTAGAVIGRVGTSGNSSGPHLHFEVHLNNDRSSGGAIDPVSFMDKMGSPLGGLG
jgi:murein DD-endopeptidase MepM/ murein hydrolase activator NlpD